jgi:integral membrane protein (TIGR00529 family)
VWPITLIIIGFILAFIVIVIIGQKNLPLALFCGSIILGFCTIPLNNIFTIFIHTISDLSVVLLAFVVFFIPMIGGIMKQSGQMDNIVQNLRIGKRGIMAASPAIMGLLPMPGGALFSAPIMEKSGEGVNDDLKVAINIWYRHLLILIYPLSSDLIATTKIVGLNIYNAILYLFPTLIIATILGQIFLLNKVQGEISYKESFSCKNLLIPLFIILIAPILDFIFRLTGLFPVKEFGTLIGVTTGFALSLVYSPIKINLTEVFKEMKPYKFSLIIIGIFFFLNIFKVSGIDKFIALIPFPPLILCIIGGFVLGIGTGRILLPSSIIFPIFLISNHVTLIDFALIYTSIFFGYVVSPIHPCIVVTCKYFSTSMKGALRLLIVPTFIIFVLVLAISILKFL